MQYKEIDPLGNNVVCACAYNFFKITHFVNVEWWATCNRTVSNRRDYAIEYNDFSTGFTSLAFAMHMNGFMFVCA